MTPDRLDLSAYLARIGYGWPTEGDVRHARGAPILPPPRNPIRNAGDERRGLRHPPCGRAERAAPARKPRSARNAPFDRLLNPPSRRSRPSARPRPGGLRSDRLMSLLIVAWHIAPASTDGEIQAGHDEGVIKKIYPLAPVSRTAISLEAPRPQQLAGTGPCALVRPRRAV